MERIKDYIHQQLPNRKLNEISSEENIQKGIRFVNLAIKIYVLNQQEKNTSRRR